jgi:hypothetical protein
MSKIQSGNAVHDDACAAADSTRSAVLATPGVTPAQAKAADIAAYRAIRASALANNCGVTQFVNALRELGTGGV